MWVMASQIKESTIPVQLLNTDERVENTKAPAE